MVSAWLKQVGAKWFSGKPQMRGVRRAGVRLELESLEERAVPALGMVTLTVTDGSLSPTIRAGHILPIKVTAENAGGLSGVYSGHVKLDVTKPDVTNPGYRVLVTTADYTMLNGVEISSTGDTLNTVIDARYTVTLSPNQGIGSSAWIGSPYAAVPLKVSVIPGPVRSFELTRPSGNFYAPTVALAVGDSKEVMITAYDAFHNVATGDNSVVNLTTNNPNGLVTKDSTNSTTIGSVTLSQGVGTFYVDAVHSTAFLNYSYFTLQASATNANGVLSQTRVLHFQRSPEVEKADPDLVNG